MSIDDMHEAELVVEIKALLSRLDAATGGKAGFKVEHVIEPVEIAVHLAPLEIPLALDLLEQAKKIEAARLSDNIIPFVRPC